MAEKFKYGPLVYNFFGEDDDSGNFWWPGSPPVGYEQPEGVWKIPVDEFGNQCLPGECILHPCCRVEKWTVHETLGNIPERDWCRSWFEDNFLEIAEYDLCRYILRWYQHNHKYEDTWKSWSKGKSVEQMISEIWPDVHKL